MILHGDFDLCQACHFRDDCPRLAPEFQLFEIHSRSRVVFVEDAEDALPINEERLYDVESLG